MPWHSRNGMPRLTRVGDIGRGDQVVGGGLEHAVAVEGAPRIMPVGDGEGEVERVDRVEEVLLVLLQVLVVGQRQCVDHAVQGVKVGDDARRLGASSSAASGFFFCGMIDDPTTTRPTA